MTQAGRRSADNADAARHSADFHAIRTAAHRSPALLKPVAMTPSFARQTFVLSLAVAVAISGAAVGARAPQRGDPAASWMNPQLDADARAEALLRKMTLAEKLRLIRTDLALPGKDGKPPAGAVGGAGYQSGNARLGIPAVQEADSGLGVANPNNVRAGDGATSLPSQLAIAASWDPQVAYSGGAMIGREAWRKGYNLLLAGGVNLQRDPRNGRNFEYCGEDPLLAGVVTAAAVRGIQDQRVLSTVKHFALNAQETGRLSLSADIGETALRESDLLAFEIAIERGRPGAVMCAYNRVNGDYACESGFLLTRVLRQEWRYPGFVMSDWGAIHDWRKAVSAGLDQESGDDRHFGRPLREGLAKGEMSETELDAMVRRILRSMFAVGLFDRPPQPGPIDVAAHQDVARRALEAGAVLLRNHNGLLPLSEQVASIAVIGAQADRGVIAGGGASTVVPWGGNAAPVPAPPQYQRWGPIMHHPSPPLAAIRALAPNSRVRFDPGDDPHRAAALAAQSQVAVVFVHQWASESFDAADLEWPQRQNELVAAVARANPRTVVVLQNNSPLNLPWLEQVGSVLEAWYAGSGGGQAIADLLFGRANPSGRLPFTWQRDAAQLPRPQLAYAGEPQGSRRIPSTLRVDYAIEGADVGYRWFQRRNSDPLFAFGYGLSYTRFEHGGARLQRRDARVALELDVANIGARRGADVVQVYVQAPGAQTRRLAGFAKVELAAGERRRVRVELEPRLLAEYDPARRARRIRAGEYRFYPGRSATDLAAPLALRLPDIVLPPPVAPSGAASTKRR